MYIGKILIKKLPTISSSEKGKCNLLTASISLEKYKRLINSNTLNKFKRDIEIINPKRNVFNISL